VYSPKELITPHPLPVQPVPLTLHVTLLLPVPLTEARNCCVVPAVTVADVGEMVTLMGGTIVTIAVLDFVGSATEVAVTETTDGVGIVAGAV
jgi:hypothetical protein